MNFFFRIPGYEPVEKITGRHKRYFKSLIPGAKPLKANGDFGVVYSQQVDMDEAGFVLLLTDLTRPLDVNIIFSKPVAVAQLMLEGEVTTGDIQAPVYLPKAYCDLRYAAELKTILSFNSPGSSKILFIYFNVAGLLQTLKFFPQFEHFEKSINKQKVNSLSAEKIAINAKMADIIFKLLHAPFGKNTQHYQLQIIESFIYLLLKQAASSEKLLPVNMEDIECVHAAKLLIDQHLPEHLSISQISEKAGISQQKLKQIFKAVYGKGVFEYFHHQLMIMAQSQLEFTRNPVKQISRNLGYRSVPNFNIAFKKHFGIAPAAWRKHALAKKPE